MKHLTIREHSSSSYAPRTYHNANSADVTIAIAMDYDTAGEKLTHKAAGSKYLRLDPSARTPTENARILYKHMRDNNLHTINVAGNGIYTLSKWRLSQNHINEIVYSILYPVSKYWNIDCIVTGGQSGVDLAGAIAGVRLNIPTVVTYPKGYKMRFLDNKDVTHTEEQIRQIIKSYIDGTYNVTSYISQKGPLS